MENIIESIAKSFKIGLKIRFEIEKGFISSFISLLIGKKPLDIALKESYRGLIFAMIAMVLN